ncbi:tetratricopeptide repeat protein [Pontibacter silvestris]|uniref:Tetratricopeptide repeat protein n=1 Tax=Pontibacter silvestris TaxID=2305183 RepID=A0ABW4X0K9_9BACT|nr:tetratricopeptide repeat protein [Pontibacter silvestris]MCC9136110.1 tetratricopeptide repeat protein [Pontibacter silvestris]
MVGRIYKMLVLLLSVIFVSCNTDKGDQERMVNLQQVSNNVESQLENLSAAIAKSKRDGSLYARRAVVLLRRGELDQALQDADRAVKLTKNEPASLFVKAQVLRVMGREGEALPLALRAERNSYQSSSLYVLLGEMYLQRRDYQKALVYLNKAQELSPADEFAFYYKGRVLAATGDTARAEHYYKQALENASSFMEPQRELAGIYIAQDDFAIAGTYINGAIKLAPNDGQVLYYKGLSYLSAQKPDSAQQYFVKALSVNDTLQGANYQLGIMRHSQGDNAAAIAHLEKVVSKVYINRPKYMTTLASSYERTGQYANSLAQYHRLVNIEPSYTFAYESISRLKYKLSRPKPDSTKVRQVTSEEQ